METPVSYTDMPHPAEQVGLQFRNLADEAEMNQNNNFSIRIFTDGSKIQGKVGAALSVWNNVAETRTRKLKLDHFCTVYQAELFALCEASKQVLKTAADDFGIYCDSRSALETVVGGVSLHPLAVKI